VECELKNHPDGSLNCTKGTHRNTYGEYRCDHHGYKHDERGVVIVITYLDLVLATYRNDTEPLNFGLPGGKVDPDEADWFTASRELREETGLEVTPAQMLPLWTKWCKNPPNKGWDPRGRLCTAFAANTELSREFVKKAIYNTSAGVPKKDLPILIKPAQLLGKECDFWEYNRDLFRALGRVI
jgi:8-oxo-dGTP pyrophosphatase MutT (NUDIX family)